MKNETYKHQHLTIPGRVVMEIVKDLHCENDRVENIMQGEFVKRKPDCKKVYTRGAYNRHTGKYELNDVSDISRSIEVKKSTVLYINFDF